MPKKINGDSTKEMLVEDFVEEHVADPHGIFDDEAKMEQIIAEIKSKPPKSEKSNVFANKVATYKRAFDEMEKDDDEGKPSAAKKAKTDMEDIARAYAVYKVMKNAELQDVLRWNLGYATSGTKDVLLVRYIEVYLVVTLSAFDAHIFPNNLSSFDMLLFHLDAWTVM